MEGCRIGDMDWMMFGCVGWDDMGGYFMGDMVWVMKGGYRTGATDRWGWQGRGNGWGVTGWDNGCW